MALWFYLSDIPGIYTGLHLEPEATNCLAIVFLLGEGGTGGQLNIWAPLKLL